MLRKSRGEVLFFYEKDCFFDLKYCRLPSKFSSVVPRARKGRVVNKLLTNCACSAPFFVSGGFSAELRELREKSATEAVRFSVHSATFEAKRLQSVPVAAVAVRCAEEECFGVSKSFRNEPRRPAAKAVNNSMQPYQEGMNADGPGNGPETGRCDVSSSFQKCPPDTLYSMAGGNF